MSEAAIVTVSALGSIDPIFAQLCLVPAVVIIVGVHGSLLALVGVEGRWHGTHREALRILVAHEWVIKGLFWKDRGHVKSGRGWHKAGRGERL